MYAIVETGGKQYRIKEGDIFQVEKLDVPEGETVEFDKVLALSNENGFSAGQPYLENVKVIGEVLEHDKDKKIIVYKYKPKKNYRKKQGHRQPFTKVKIKSIQF